MTAHMASTTDPLSRSWGEADCAFAAVAAAFNATATVAPPTLGRRKLP